MPTVRDDAYVHGYDPRESERLGDQAGALVELLHHDIAYPAGSRVLEAGCGVGAQTLTLAAHSPQAQITSVDVSEVSLAQARERVRAPNVTFRQGDLFDLPFAPASFDHVFVCFVLEHLREPERALAILRELLRPGGTITVIEGDHGSTYFHPRNADADAAVACLVELQARAGGDSLIGRRLYPLLEAAGFADIAVEPRVVYVDGGHPELIEAFTRRTFTAMVAGVREQAVQAGLLSPERFDAGIAALERAAEPDGTFNYTFFKGVAVRSR
jgi:SAM-dependent methyltransferase